MHSWFKINTALIICLAFIFKVLFVNIGLLSSFNTSHSQANKLQTKHFSIKKRRRPVEVSVPAGSKEYATVEVCEENSDNEETQVKASASVLLCFLFYSLLKGIPGSFRLNPAFDLIKCNLHPKKYLALSILRI